MQRRNQKIQPPTEPNIPSVSTGTPQTSTSSLMIRRAVASAKRHGISVCQGTPNSADGNCAIESVLYNIKDRPCFPDSLPFSADYYRRIWVTDFKNRTVNDPTWNIYSREQWEEGWTEMMESGVYERDLFGDLMMFSIACGVKKVLLIFNTNVNSPHDPIYVCDPRKFGVQTDTNMPVVLAYDLSHYESLHPLTSSDDQKTSELVEQYLTGNYGFGKTDLLYLICTEEQEVSSETSEDLMKDEKENQGERPQGAKSFQESLPEYLRGKRPRDMNQEEKREYNNLRRKLSRKNESREQSRIRKQKEAEEKAKRRENENEEEKKKRNMENRKASSSKRGIEQKRKVMITYLVGDNVYMV